MIQPCLVLALNRPAARWAPVHQKVLNLVRPYLGTIHVVLLFLIGLYNTTKISTIVASEVLYSVPHVPQGTPFYSAVEKYNRLSSLQVG